MCSGRSRGKKSPRSGDARGRVLCIDTLPFVLRVSIHNTLFKKRRYPITSINFSNKPPSVRTLRRDEGKGDPVPFRVVKVIQLTAKEFERFMSHLLDDAPYIAANTTLTGKDPNTGDIRCLLVMFKGGRSGILVNSEGYGYARYAAYVRDISRLELEQIPVEQYRKPRARQER